MYITTVSEVHLLQANRNVVKCLCKRKKMCAQTIFFYIQTPLNTIEIMF